MQARADRCLVALIVCGLVSSCGGTSATTNSRSASARILYVSGATNLGVRTIGADGNGLRLLTAHAPAGNEAAWVARGRAVSFWASDEGLWLMTSSGGWPRRVARASDYSTLSPSGTKVAIVAGNLTIADSHLHVLRRYRLKLHGADSFNSPEQTAWSPDERRVAFQVLGEDSAGDEPGRLLVVDLASGHIVTIRAGDSVDSDPPAWSPDGRRLAYLAEAPSSTIDDLYVSTPDGKNKIKVAHDVSNDQFLPLVWSPDGSRIAFTRTTGSRRPFPGAIFVVSSQGGHEQRIATGRGIAAQAWSRDGTRLAFSAVGGVFVANMRGGANRLTRDGAQSSVAWAPSNRILFGSAKSISSIDGNGRGLRTLGRTLDDGWPVWSPDGRMIAFARGHNSHDIDVAGDVWTVTVRGRNPRNVGAGYEPTWSPDSRRLAYVRTVGGKPAVVVQRPGGRASIVGHGTSPSWSPDGTLVAFIKDGTQVLVVSPDGTHARVLLDGVDFEDVNGVASEHYRAPIVWDPHGDELAVAASLLEEDGTDDGDHVRVARVAGGASRTLSLFAGSGLDWSPDGKLLVGASEEGLATIAAHGSASETIVSSNWPLILTNPAWSPDSRQLTFTACRREHCEIRVAARDGSAQHGVVDVTMPDPGFGPVTSFTPRWQP